MKLKQFTKIVAVSSFGSVSCILASCKDSAKETTNSIDKPAVSVTANTVPVYIVTVSGRG